MSFKRDGSAFFSPMSNTAAMKSRCSSCKIAPCRQNTPLKNKINNNNSSSTCRKVGLLSIIRRAITYRYNLYGVNTNTSKRAMRQCGLTRPQLANLAYAWQPQNVMTLFVFGAALTLAHASAVVIGRIAHMTRHDSTSPLQ